MTFIVGAVAVFYSVNLFLASSSQPEEPTVLRVSQWSGYIAASDIQNSSPVVSSVSASWIVPEVKSSENNTFSGVWVGIGGYGEETLIQTGTEQECINGRFVYYAWYELFPDYLIRIPSLHVQSGDMITASISLINKNLSTWSIEIRDVTRGEQFKKVVVYNSSMLSAEWIVERPKVNGAVSTLADFGNVTFTECKATVDGVTGAIGNFSYAQLVMHDEDTSLVSVSPLNDDESGFTVSYLEPPSPTASADDLTIQNIAIQSGDAFSVYPKTAVSKNLRNFSGV
ncbi:hypothetical protein JXA31_00855 [Candidatus Bathyarchaeota archaeon]|nr:hypothetical protein [Candidatus Bathyarchaeota archaeon]